MPHGACLRPRPRAEELLLVLDDLHLIGEQPVFKAWITSSGTFRPANG
jgi:hypothetical protein